MSRFAGSYNERYGAEPDAFAALSYDAVHILAEAIQKAGGSSPERVKEALYGIQDFPGVTGRTTFDVNGDVIKSISIKQIKAGTFDYLVPEYFNP